MHSNTKRFIESFWNQVNKTESCWIWIGKTDRDGYGAVSIFNDLGSNRIRGAHRISAYLNGRDPRGHFVCHTCDNPSCVNPNHLVIADAQWNNSDKTIKGRNAKFPGTANHMSKLTEELVKQIRIDDRHYAVIAKELNVHPETVRMAKIGKTWRHI